MLGLDSDNLLTLVLCKIEIRDSLTACRMVTVLNQKMKTRMTEAPAPSEEFLLFPGLEREP